MFHLLKTNDIKLFKIDLRTLNFLGHADEVERVLLITLKRERIRFLIN
jgi:hypothetical protein